MAQDMTGPKSSAGKLHLLDFADIKAQIGDRWTRMGDPMERFFEGAVRRNLGPGDTFFRQGELSYILLFRDLSAEEAQLKCRTISEQVCERLFGDQVHRASLRILVAPLDQDQIAGTAVSSALDELLERKGKEVIFQASTAKDAPGRNPPVAKDADPIAATEAYSFIFRPIWDATKNVVITYLCQRDMDEAKPQTDGDPAVRPEDRQADIDGAVLRECAARTDELHRNGLRILSGVSVCLDTLSHSRLWAAYSKTLHGITPAISRDFAFFVTGIDSGVPNIRLAQELPKLTRLSRQLFCLIDGSGYVGTRFSRTGAHAIGIELTADEAETSAMGRIFELGHQAAEAGLAAFVLGIPSTSIMLYALGQGIRYLEGAVIRPPVSNPRHAFAQSLEYVYLSGNAAPDKIAPNI
jgi:GGDEF domain-containing protein